MRRDYMAEIERDDIEIISVLAGMEDMEEMSACEIESVCGVDISVGVVESSEDRERFIKEMFDDYEISGLEELDAELAEFLAMEEWEQEI